jgi:HlyD family secretion protein
MLHPDPIIEHTTEAYLPQVSVQSQLIYTTILVALIVAIVALPFIYVDVSVQSMGVVRPVAEKNELKSLVTATVAEVLVHENEKVHVNQPLVRLQTDVLDSKLRLNLSQQQEKQLFIQDLIHLVGLHQADLLKPQRLQSPLYRQQYAQFTFVVSEQLITQTKREEELVVDRKLYADKVIAKRELEDKEFAYQSVHSQYLTTIEKQLSQWQADLTTQKLELTELQAQEKQLRKEKEWYSIKAPVAGTVGQLAGKYPGSSVQAGEVLGVISPDSNLVVECYVSPKDIGHLRTGMLARLQVDAFNYNQWGMIEGNITEVANDFFLLDQQPVFKVKCRLKQNYLRLPNGYQGRLKKGMTIRAHFVVTSRTLWQLLYDKADDWLNPIQG